jgi:molybdopterin molybdotransferase
MTAAAKFPPLRSLDDTLAELLQQVHALAGTEQLDTFDADRRVLAADIVSPLSVPGFDNSAMDGYALHSRDCTGVGSVLRVTQRIAAGQMPKPLAAGEAARIFTGAPVPAGADAVVMQEDCTDLGDGTVRVNSTPPAGQHIRRRGEDIAQGSIVLSKGELLTPAALGLIASIGQKTVTVTRRARVALLSTGNELVMPGDVAPQDMPTGAIYNSNRYFLRALLQRAGCVVTDLGIVPDNFEATLQALKSAAQNHDVIVTSGGVSVGEEDHVKPAVQQLGSLDLWSISMKPGKPFAYGQLPRVLQVPQAPLAAGAADSSQSGVVASSVVAKDGTASSDAAALATHRAPACHFVGLPGNPVSSLVTFLLLVRPLLARLQGQHESSYAMPSVAAHADFIWPRADKRREFLRVKRNASGGLDLYPNQGSGVLTSAVWADGLVDVPAGSTIAAGDSVRFIPFSELLG